jgi:hypothetical protein
MVYLGICRYLSATVLPTLVIRQTPPLLVAEAAKRMTWRGSRRSDWWPLRAVSTISEAGSGLAMFNLRDVTRSSLGPLGEAGAKL